MRPALLVAALAFVPVAGPAMGPAPADARPRPQPADAKGGTGPVGKAAPACGVKVLPLVAGNEWTYSFVAAPAPADDSIKRLLPPQPKTVVITVKSVQPVDAKKGSDTVVTLEEKSTYDLTKDEKKPILDTRSVTTTITCNDKKFDIDPKSFFFAGEPGGSFGLDLDKLERPKGTSWQLTKGAIGDAEWREDIVAHWTRKVTEGTGAKPGSGKLELERRFTPQQPEPVTTKMGMYRAEKLGLITTGRVTLENASPDAKPMELPANWVSQLWIAEGVGVVQSLNSFAHMYQLTDAKLQ